MVLHKTINELVIKYTVAFKDTLYESTLSLCDLFLEQL